MTREQIEQKISKLKEMYNLVKNDIPHDLTITFPATTGHIEISREEVIEDITGASVNYITELPTHNGRVWAEYYNNIYIALKQL